MPRAVARDPIYRGRRFPSETIELCVRWYITYRLSYRNLVEMMADSGVAVTHTTIMRWVLKYLPEYERRWARFARPLNSSWRMDETAVSVRGGRHYVYRAVDRHGKSVDSLLCADRTMESALAFLQKATSVNGGSWPTKINLDGNAASHRALRLLRLEDSRWASVTVRARRYLNNVVEQDHRAIKQRCASMLGFKSFRTAAITLAGVELAHRIRKQQFSVAGSGSGGIASLKHQWDQALSQEGVPVSERNASSPAMHQNSIGRGAEPGYSRAAGSVRYPRKIFRGRGLYLLVTPQGGRYWRYKYRYKGSHKTLALGVFPDVPARRARARHHAARQWLAVGIDPALKKEELRRSQARP